MFHLLAGADVNGRTANGHFPLAGAAFKGHAQAAQYLIEHGAKVNMLTAFHWSPLYIAVVSRHLDVARVLLSAGASTKPQTIPNEYGTSPRGFAALHAAASTGEGKMVRLLLRHGADPCRKAEGRLPEDVASDAGHQAIAKLLRARRTAWAK